MSSNTKPLQQIHWTTTLLVVSFRQLTSSVLFLIVRYLNIKPFDSSHLILTESDHAGLRWDAIHYASIAMEGYRYEQQLAFMPLWPLILRISGEFGPGLRRLIPRFASLSFDLTYDDISNCHTLINIASAWIAAQYLYKLTRELTKSHLFASTACLFYAFSPHPAATVSPYTEPLYAALTFVGFFHAVRENWMWSTVFLALTSGIRATGVLNIGILGWFILFRSERPFSHHLISQTFLKRSFLAAICCLFVIAPFLGFQYYAYLSFCQDVNSSQPWCHKPLPFAYSYVQAKYWNIGLFNYWTIEQIPNFLLAMPVYLVSIIPTYRYFKAIIANDKAKTTAIPLHSALLPFQIHHLALTLLLIFQSHVQIALRVSVTDPVVWWNVASIAFDWESPAFRPSRRGDGEVTSTSQKDVTPKPKMTRAGKWWTRWVFVWGTVSLFLWAGHYPPA